MKIDGVKHPNVGREIARGSKNDHNMAISFILVLISEDIWTDPQGTASPIFHTRGGTGMEAVGFLDNSMERSKPAASGSMLLSTVIQLYTPGPYLVRPQVKYLPRLTS